VIWLEMSRNEEHGGEGWNFAECLWAPSRKVNGARWPFWESLLQVEEDDLVLHLRGKRNPQFVGFSIAVEGGYETTRRPTEPEQWDYAESFFRVALRDFSPFKLPIDLKDVFRFNERELKEYRNKNRELPADQRRHIFYAVEDDKLRRQESAYLSEVDSELLGILLGCYFKGEQAPSQPALLVDVETGQQLRQTRARIGQQAFSEVVKANYGLKCCFPECHIDEERFLVGSHIARWNDAPELRGDMSNGICLCLMHDRAFELGLFTITSEHMIWVSKDKIHQSKWALQNLLPFHSHSMRSGSVLPSEQALRYHWERIGYTPGYF
jgi:putative restriction endonuclease